MTEGAREFVIPEHTGNVIFLGQSQYNSVLDALYHYLLTRAISDRNSAEILLNLSEEELDAILEKYLNVEGFLKDSLQSSNLGPLEVSDSYVPPEVMGELETAFAEAGLDLLPTNQVVLSTLLFSLITHALVSSDEIRTRPNGVLDPKNLGLRFPTQSDTSDLALILFNLKESQNLEDQQSYRSIEENFSRIFPGYELLVSFVRSGDFPPGHVLLQSENARSETIDYLSIFRVKLFVMDKNLGKTIPLESMGSGVLEALHLLALVMGTSEKVILLDEPTTHLHPTKQKRLIAAILDSSRKDNQLILITHSPFVLTSKYLDNIVSFRRGEKGGTELCCSNQSINSNIRAKIGRWIDQDQNLRNALFADKVILVEGEEEEGAIPTWFSAKYNFSLDDRNITLFSVHGDQNIPLYSEILDRWCIAHLIVCDLKAREAVKQIKPEGVLFIPADDFASYLSSKFPELYVEAGKRFKDSKPLKGRYLAEKVSPPADFAESILSKIKQFANADNLTH